DRHRQRNGIAHASAQEIVDRRLQQLAGNIVEGHVDGGFGWVCRPRELYSRIKQLMRPIDVESVLSDQRRRKEVVDDRTECGAIAVPDHADFSEPGDACGSLHLDNAEARVFGEAESTAK